MKVLYNAFLSFLIIGISARAQSPNLRLVNQSTGEVANSIHISTDDIVSLCAQGLIGLGGTDWEYISVEWQTPRLIWPGSILPPDHQQCMTIHSEIPVSDFIKIKGGDDSLSIPLVINSVDSIEGIFITLITNPANWSPGDTLRTVVNIGRQDGLIPDTVCLDSIRYSFSGLTAGTTESVMIINGAITKPDTINNQCFINGIDTVDFILYELPQSSDICLISVTYNNLSDTTISFSLSSMSVRPESRSQTAFKTRDIKILKKRKSTFSK